tara:strand:+ start:515 stop:1048 length:534 start_codon:yes stop_codon:yes gene_type:complete
MNKTSLLGRIYRRYLIFNTLNNYLKGRCLDIGCGIGGFVKYRNNTDAADINPISIKLLIKDGFNAFVIEKDKISVKDNTYDSLLMDNVLEHIQHPDNLLLECKRIIKTDGIFIIGVPGKKGFESELDHKIHYDETKLVSKLNNFKFEHIKTFYKPFKLKLLDKHMKQYCMYLIFKSI